MQELIDPMFLLLRILLTLSSSGLPLSLDTYPGKEVRRENETEENFVSLLI